MRVDLRPLESGMPGQGRLLLTGWSGATTTLQLMIQENQDKQFLHPDKSWSTKPHSFEVASLEEADAERLQVVLGSTIIDPLLELPGSTQYMLTLQDAEGTKAESVIRLSRNLMPSSAAGAGPSASVNSVLQTPTVEKTPEPEPALKPEPESVVTTPSEHEPEKTRPDPAPVEETYVDGKTSKRGPLLFILAALLLLAAVAFGAWYWFSNNNTDPEPVIEETTEEKGTEEENTEEATEETGTEEEVTEEASREEEVTEEELPESTEEPLNNTASSSAVPATACSIEALDQQDELTFVQGCSEAEMTAGALLEVIEAARNADYCGVARRLYANRAIAGDATIALAYAREYDPAYHQESTCFASSDAETAGYWYQTVLDIDPDNSEAQARIEELSE